MRFSERYGYKEVRQAIQVETMDDRLRTSLWNVLETSIFSSFSHPLQGSQHAFMTVIWDFIGWTTDTVPWSKGEVVRRWKTHFFEVEWMEVYDLIERVVAVAPYPFSSMTPGLAERLNRVLARENAGYRFIDGQLAPVSSIEEVEAIEGALAATSQLAPVQTHLRAALGHLADREAPDYRNSVKESISAVESLCSVLAGKKDTLGQNIKVVADNLGLHPALRNAFSSLYGYTSDADGIRHGLMDEPNLGVEDARFMLVTCSAFINYLIEKAGHGA